MLPPPRGLCTRDSVRSPFLVWYSSSNYCLSKPALAVVRPLDGEHQETIN